LPYSGLRDNVYVDVRGARITHAEKTWTNHERYERQNM
jgi:hypothetical protein